MTGAPVSHGGPYTAEELENMKSSRRAYGEGMPFRTLVTSFLHPLDQIKRSSTQVTVVPAKRKQGKTSGERRYELVEGLIKATADHRGDMYPVIRLVAPELDLESPAYGIKEAVMARILPLALLFHGRNSADRIRLAEWGPGSKDKFIDICRDTIQKRVARETSTVTVGWVCGHLDQLRSLTKDDERAKVLSTMSSSLTPDELTWVVRLILDDVHLGVKSIFLSTWHDDAEQLMMSRSCLRLVCWELDAANQATGTRDLGVKLSRCFQPQLASRQVKRTDGTLEDLVQETLKLLRVAGKPFLIEEKLDGERMQVHITVDREKRMHFRWWSRNGVDYTYKFGSSESEGTLARYVSGALVLPEHKPLTSMVLDGEMVVWDSESATLLPHKSYQPIADHGPTIWPMFRAFDILIINGFTVSGNSLSDRQRLMAAYIVGVPHRFERHCGTTATTADQLKAAFVDVVRDGGEGLVVKDLSSPYNPGCRLSSWVKLKPEYSSEYDNPLDCVLIGRSYGKGQNAGKLTRLLCGIREGGQSGLWLSFCGLGSGISRAVRDTIEMRTEGRWSSWGDGAEASKYIKLGRGGYEAPDQWIVPDQSIVISVKTSTISNSHLYAAGAGLLHPRFDRLPDLKPSQALSKDDIEALDPVRDIRKSVAASRKPAKQPAVLTLAVQPSDAAMATTAETKLFEGMSFYIGADCDELGLSKDDMVVMVRKNGGRVFYDSREATYAVCHKITYYISVRIKAGKNDIIHPRWLVECVKQQRVTEPDESCHVLWERKPSIKDDTSSDDDDDFFEPVRPRCGTCGT